jgi:hypothetical protein
VLFCFWRDLSVPAAKFRREPLDFRFAVRAKQSQRAAETYFTPGDGDYSISAQRLLSERVDVLARSVYMSS